MIEERRHRMSDLIIDCFAGGGKLSISEGRG